MSGRGPKVEYIGFNVQKSLKGGYWNWFCISDNPGIEQFCIDQKTGSSTLAELCGMTKRVHRKVC